MSQENKQSGWTVNKKAGYVSEIQWYQLEDDATNIWVHHFIQQSNVFSTIGEKIVKYSEEPYENDEAFVFTDVNKMHDWLREDATRISRKLQNYLERLSTVDPRANLMTQDVWPKNFIMGYLPKNYRTHTRVYLSPRKISEYTVDAVVEYAEKQLGMPLSAFKRVWQTMEYSPYNNEFTITLAVDNSEQSKYFSENSPAVSDVTSQINTALNMFCPDLQYNLMVNRVPRYLFGDDKHLVRLDSNFSNEFFKILGANIKTKLSNAMRRPLQHRANIMAYLVGSDMIGKVPSYVLPRSIILPYAFASGKCYTVYAPVDINVWSRPDGTLIVDSHLATGSAELTKLNTSLSSGNILDQLLEMSQ